jgi:hypothetical protein
LQALASYTWSHSIDTASNDSSSNVPTELINPQRDRGPSDFDVRHSFSVAVTYNLPSTTTNNFAKAALSNWAVDSIFYARPATPVNVVTGTAIFGVSNVFRPNVIEGIPLYLNDPLAPEGGGSMTRSIRTGRDARVGFVRPQRASKAHSGVMRSEDFP